MAKDNIGKSEHPLVGKGLIFKTDPKSKNFPMYGASPTLSDDMRQSWKLGPVLDQGQTSQCCAYAWTQFLQTEPWNETNIAPPAELYHAAQLTDGLGGVEPLRISSLATYGPHL